MGWFSDSCKHAPVSGYEGGVPYGGLSFDCVDGMNVVHYSVMVRCRYCNKEYAVAKFHTNIAAMRAHENRFKEN